MTQSGESIILEIHDLARGGSGVARADDGRVVFVPFTAPGDQIRARITKNEKRYAHAELVEILRPSPTRQKPPCQVFGKCGGCQWQHLPYELQWKTKVSGVANVLNRAGIRFPALEELPAERIWGYRNRIQLRGKDQTIGFLASSSHQLIPIERCEIARPEINSALPQLRKAGAERGGEYKVEIEVLENGETREAWDREHAALGFRQVHDEQNEKLRAWIKARLMETDGNVYDLFGGSGNLSLQYAVQAPSAEIHCVDMGAPGSRPAGAPENIHFHRESSAKWLFRQSLRPGKWVAIIDPPREGLAHDHGKIADSLERLGVSGIAAIGCDVDSWVRDLSNWVKRGWIPKRGAILDLFPQTPHVESLAWLERVV
ncbi:MAG: TRAM domain-containing protein [Oligoflexia bacterium]|nr:TRAM domain-containing protein [Oligoflexia bacterium]